jgi:hypothetical protein
MWKVLRWFGPAVVFLFVLGVAMWSLSLRSPLRQDCPQVVGIDDHTIWEKTRSDPVALYTFWLAVLTAFLVAVSIVQIRFLTRADTTARVAADAAKKSADAAVSIELPILRAIPSDLMTVDAPIPESGPYSGGGNDGVPTRYSAIGDIRVQNFGRTPAFPITLSAGWRAARALPIRPEYTKTVGVNHAVVYRPASEDPDTEYHVDFACTVELSELEIREIAAETSWLWFYGLFKFRDFMGVERESRFCWRWANRNSEGPAFFFFASDGNPPSAYLRAQQNQS